MVVFHKDPMGITVSICVYILLFYGDWAIVYHVIEYGKHANARCVQTNKSMSLYTFVGQAVKLYAVLLANNLNIRTCI